MTDSDEPEIIANIQYFPDKLLEKAIVQDCYWIDNDFYLIRKDGSKRIFHNCYLTDIKYEGLDFCICEDVTFVGNSKYWSK
jgi:hypothetical protein